YVQWIYADTVTTTNYDLEGNNPVSNYQVNIYGNPAHMQVTEQKTGGSDGIVQRVLSKYPHEMVADGAGAPYPAMIAANLVEKKIEDDYYKDLTFLQAVKTDYGDWGNQVFEPAGIQTKAAGGNWDPRIVFYGYTTSGGLQSQSKYLGPKSSYLWGYDGLLPVAEAKNAAYNEIFYDGFESNTLVPTSEAHTGTRAKSGEHTVNFSPPAGKSYFISWYELVAGKWVYKKEAYTGSKTFDAVSGVYRDDICIYPTDALMSFYTFDPAVGVTAITDVKGETSFFEYDKLQRLSNVRDQWRNIVKNYQYNFNISAPTNVYYNGLQSQSFTKSCTAGVGSTVTYQVYAGTYSSVISLQDANNQALADIAANGQDYANSKGECATGNRPIAFVNNTYPPTGTKTSGINGIKLKNAAGTVLFTYTQSQVNAGIAPPVGTYNIEIETFGSAYNPSTQLGWTTLELVNQNYSASYSLTRSGSSTTYTFPNINLAAGTSWSIIMSGSGLD
ncbi:DUF5977 domain-containing protein, partial [Mucilaginibacter pedocola]|uniref:DUF5977 domain-containing protein n=1 Tax=Mucilaginibacter pedocola TaxID=1792845 RepID=UPI00139006A6